MARRGLGCSLAGARVLVALPRACWRRTRLLWEVAAGICERQLRQHPVNTVYTPSLLHIRMSSSTPPLAYCRTVASAPALRPMRLPNFKGHIAAHGTNAWLEEARNRGRPSGAGLIDLHPAKSSTPPRNAQPRAPRPVRIPECRHDSRVPLPLDEDTGTGRPARDNPRPAAPSAYPPGSKPATSPTTPAVPRQARKRRPRARNSSQPRSGVGITPARDALYPPRHPRPRVLEDG